MAKTIKEKLDIFLQEKFQEMKLEEAIGDRFGKYSKYIIQERAIPDVRDGLKPVQRRILYGMNNMKVTSNAPYKKSARIVGEVMGKYHPHGDSSIYEALVRMSQTWKMGVKLIDMHGNNGSIDGDGPAAMRYTETRLAKTADYLLQDIEKNTVPFIPNFDEEETEPTVLPARFPNLLVNGAMGISSGYATNIPTHNINEVISATIALIDNPNMNVDELLTIMPGPDFPTGGIIMGREGIRDAFLTGAGCVTIRSKYHIEETKTGTSRIVIDEIPFDTIKSKTVERMEQLRIDGKLPDVVEVRDESGRDGLRIAIDLKQSANVDAILNYFFKNTDLQYNFNYNMVSICDRKPVRQGVIPILGFYIEHQKDVVTNRTNYDLNKANKRMHIVIGLIKMIDVVDEVIHTIRQSKNKADSIQNLVAKFGFTEEQAEAIVMMRLYSLSNQDIDALKNEFNELRKAIDTYKKILGSDKELMKVIKHELEEINKAIDCPRKTEINDESSQIKIDEMDLVSKEQCVICISKDGYLKRANLKSFNQSKLNTLKENDSILYMGEVSTLDSLLIFTTLGNFISLPVYKIPECKYKDVGTFISTLVSTAPKERFINIFNLAEYDKSAQAVLVTKMGSIKQCLLSSFEASRMTKPVKAMKLANGDELVSVDITSNPLEILLFSHNSDVLRFRASDVPLYGNAAGGLKAMNLKPDDYIVSVQFANKNDDFLLLTSRDTIKRMKVSEIVLTKRARAGQRAIKLVKAKPYYVIDAKKLTPNQYKENVKINLVCKNGNEDLEAFSLKYNVSDCGRTIDIADSTHTEILSLDIPKPSKPDEIVSADYLEENGIFEMNMDSFDDEKPIPAQKATTAQSLLDDLDAILAGEGKISPRVEENKEEKKETNQGFKRINLFDDENND